MLSSHQVVDENNEEIEVEDEVTHLMAVVMGGGWQKAKGIVYGDFRYPRLSMLDDVWGCA